ncbi:hypothetical protein A9A89_1189 [Bifidobacterium psychraerophilum DSM 22366]|nr:hypothetical protein A9A89_1189 [Bifidobacterium psychraerophilum DSM 22366]
MKPSCAIVNSSQVGATLITTNVLTALQSNTHAYGSVAQQSQTYESVCGALTLHLAHHRRLFQSLPP